MDDILSITTIIFYRSGKNNNWINKYDLYANKKELLRILFKNISHDMAF